MDMSQLKTNIRRFFTNPNTLTFILVIGLIIVIYVIYSYMINAAVKPSSLPYATNTLLEKSEITQDDIGKVDISGTFISNDGDNLVQQQGQIIGKYVNNGYTIIKNSFFYNETLTTAAVSETTFLTNIPDGYTVYKLKTSFHQTYGNSIMSGNYIDLYLHGEVELAGSQEDKDENDNRSLIYEQFVKSIQVLGVVDGRGLDVFLNTEEGKAPEPTNLYFAVPIEVFELLNKAEMLGCQLVPVPRNAGYTENPEETKIVNITLQAMIENKSIFISRDGN